MWLCRGTTTQRSKAGNLNRLSVFFCPMLKVLCIWLVLLKFLPVLNCFVEKTHFLLHCVGFIVRLAVISRRNLFSPFFSRQISGVNLFSDCGS